MAFLAGGMFELSQKPGGAAPSPVGTVVPPSPPEPLDEPLEEPLDEPLEPPLDDPLEEPLELPELLPDEPPLLEALPVSPVEPSD
jgi:hypothetical protein